MHMNRKFWTIVLLALTAISASAQQVNTLYFLENAPMRHTINPAFQPVSKGYINFSPLGWMTLGVGNNVLTISDMFYVDPATGKTVTPLHPEAGNKQLFLKQFNRSMLYFNTDLTLGLLNMGFRIKDDGYLTIGFNEHIEVGETTPKSMFEFILNGGMTDLTGGTNVMNFNGLGLGATLYTEMAVGYSHRLDEQWTIGGKLKILFGQMDMSVNSKMLQIKSNPEWMNINTQFGLNVAGPIDFSRLPSAEGKTMQEYTQEFQNGGVALDSLVDYRNVWKMITPSGMGAAIDFGFAYKPIENLQLSVALNDLGFIYWYKAQKYNCNLDTTFNGVGEFDYGDPAFRDDEGNFSTQLLLDSVKNNLIGIANSATFQRQGKGYCKMPSAKLNIGLDANFWENRIGFGIVSATRLYNARLYEELTIGLAFRPCNWFNIAASYSLMENGKYSNIGAGLSFMPYDGINMTLAMDYIPTSYAAIQGSQKPLYVIPDKTKKINLALGFSICWGSNRRDKDKDGVWDKLDMCPNTPLGVAVDERGCPLDEDHDGVPDYLDLCPGTPQEAIGFVDSVGCPLDSDGDGVEDYRDFCPGTPKEVNGLVDSIGCPLDTDGDGVPDYIDQCPGTPKEAYGKIDTLGCPLDTDGDGVPDYLDQCPGTPQEAYGKIDSVGCPLDTDGDGVPDYRDECPNTKPEAIKFVDAKGCDADTDGDGVPDYMDECPAVPGVKANKGCPEVKREVRQLLQKAMQGIEFETGKASIKKKSFPLLNQIAKVFVENGNYIVEVQGHTDNTGNADFNKKLSEQRANSVMKYLISQGVPDDRLSAHGYGMEVPIADNKTKAGRQKNRRVEFKITFEEVHFETFLDHADPQPEQPAQPEQQPEQQAQPAE